MMIKIFTIQFFIQQNNYYEETILLQNIASCRIYAPV